jgi:Zn ribbon nucleic-acid-binding protein
MCMCIINHKHYCPIHHAAGNNSVLHSIYHGPWPALPARGLACSHVEVSISITLLAYLKVNWKARTTLIYSHPVACTWSWSLQVLEGCSRLLFRAPAFCPTRSPNWTWAWLPDGAHQNKVAAKECLHCGHWQQLGGSKTSLGMLETCRLVTSSLMAVIPTSSSSLVDQLCEMPSRQHPRTLLLEQQSGCLLAVRSAIGVMRHVHALWLAPSRSLTGGICGPPVMQAPRF